MPKCGPRTEGDRFLLCPQGPQISTARSAWSLAGRSDRDDIDEPQETLEVFRVARIDRESCGTGRCRNQEIQCTSATSLASAGDLCSVDPSVGASRLPIEGKGIERRFCSLQTVLPASPLVGVDRRVRPGGELCHG